MTSIISYNVNGIRAAINKGFDQWLSRTSPDVICLQESKAQPDQVDFSFVEELGYHHHWVSAEKKGYSGVVTISKKLNNEDFIKKAPDHVVNKAKEKHESCIEKQEKLQATLDKIKELKE